MQFLKEVVVDFDDFRFVGWTKAVGKNKLKDKLYH
jgi:hypothetical protein